MALLQIPQNVPNEMVARQNTQALQMQIVNENLGDTRLQSLHGRHIQLRTQYQNNVERLLGELQISLEHGMNRTISRYNEELQRRNIPNTISQTEQNNISLHRQAINILASNFNTLNLQYRYNDTVLTARLNQRPSQEMRSNGEICSEADALTLQTPEEINALMNDMDAAQRELQNIFSEIRNHANDVTNFYYQKMCALPVIPTANTTAKAAPKPRP